MQFPIEGYKIVRVRSRHDIAEAICYVPESLAQGIDATGDHTFVHHAHMVICSLRQRVLSIVTGSQLQTKLLEQMGHPKLHNIRTMFATAVMRGDVDVNTTMAEFSVDWVRRNVDRMLKEAAETEAVDFVVTPGGYKKISLPITRQNRDGSVKTKRSYYIHPEVFKAQRCDHVFLAHSKLTFAAEAIIDEDGNVVKSRENLAHVFDTMVAK